MFAPTHKLRAKIAFTIADAPQLLLLNSGLDHCSSDQLEVFRERLSEKARAGIWDGIALLSVR